MKQWLGGGEKAADDEQPDDLPSAHSGDSANSAEAQNGQQKKLQALRRVREASGGRERPLRVDPPPPSQSIEDALIEREAGRKAQARELLAQIDRGSGLRTVLRAAAALEAGDIQEVSRLLPAIAKEEPRWRLLLQTAAVLSDSARAGALVERAKQQGAPAWALAWSKVFSKEEAWVREGLVELLFADLPLSKTVAARDLHLVGAVADPEALSRYTAFAHGRDCIRRFGPEIVADLLDRARALGGP